MASLCKLVGKVKVRNEMAKGKPGEHGYMKFCAHLCLIYDDFFKSHLKTE